MTGSAKFVVCGFWLVHNTPPAEDRTNSARRKPHDSPRCNHFDYNHETAPHNGANRHGDCCNSVQLQCQHANSYAVRGALNFWGPAVSHTYESTSICIAKSFQFHSKTCGMRIMDLLYKTNIFFFFKIDIVFIFSNILASLQFVEIFYFYNLFDLNYADIKYGSSEENCICIILRNIFII